MANTKSALKAIRVSARRRAINRPIQSATKTYIKKAQQLISTDDLEAARAAVMQAVSALDRAAAKGVIHRNNAARRKSRLVRRLNLALGRTSA